jgi:hypothetical protein
MSSLIVSVTVFHSILAVGVVLLAAVQVVQALQSRR